MKSQFFSKTCELADVSAETHNLTNSCVHMLKVRIQQILKSAGLLLLTWKIVLTLMCGPHLTSIL